MKTIIEDINARQILDSRANPTIEVEITLNSGTKGISQIPSGISKGRFEAVELRDNNKNIYNGKSVYRAVENINSIIAIELIGQDASEQEKIDSIMCEIDGTQDKSNLGANAILGVSLACSRACANSLQIPLYKYLGGICAKILPTPMINILNGGLHSNNNLSIQEFMITPIGAVSFQEALKISVEVFYKLKEILDKYHYSTNVGDEGGFAPNLENEEIAIEFILDAIKKSGYTSDEIKICLDFASSEFYKNKIYEFKNKNFSTDDMINYIEKIVEKYPIISIEDPLSQDDYNGWIKLTKKLKNKCQIVGDDLFVTNTSLLYKGVREGFANAILIKPNQTGTLTETLNAINMAQNSGYGIIISHRSGDTCDDFIADLAVAVNCGQIKTGSITRGERISKYNRLLKIEQELGISSRYMGQKLFK